MSESERNLQSKIFHDKKLLRKEMRSRLAKISAACRETFSKKAAALFLNSALYKDAVCVLAFLSMSEEIDTSEIIRRALLDKKLLLVPRIIFETGEMDFYALRDAPLEMQTERNSYGIMEPLLSAEKYSAADLDEKSVCLVPALAFTKDGKRLGRGKGYYDRFLANFAGSKCGLAFSAQIVESIPVAEHDLKMDFILTEDYFLPSAL